MNTPTLDRLFACVDATWPAAGYSDEPGWRVRRGDGGGSRVSAATATCEAPDISVMEEAQSAIGQPPLVMIRDNEAVLDARLEQAGYRIKDPVTLYLAPVALLTNAPPPVSVFHVAWPPVQIEAELWAEGGIGPERLAVMDRVQGPRISILGRSSDHPAGVGFVACHDDIAMLHALEVTPKLRRQGVARHIMMGAALWAEEQGVAWLSVLVTQANASANALYASLGMEAVGQYHYRSK